MPQSLHRALQYQAKEQPGLACGCRGASAGGRELLVPAASVWPSCRAAVVCYQAAPAAGVKLGPTGVAQPQASELI